MSVDGRHIGKRVIAQSGQGDIVFDGHVVAYSIVPTVTLENDRGDRLNWRHDMCVAVPERVTIDPADDESLTRLRRAVFGPLATAQSLEDMREALVNFGDPDWFVSEE